MVSVNTISILSIEKSFQWTVSGVSGQAGQELAGAVINAVKKHLWAWLQGNRYRMWTTFWTSFKAFLAKTRKTTTQVILRPLVFDRRQKLWFWYVAKFDNFLLLLRSRQRFVEIDAQYGGRNCHAKDGKPFRLISSY